MLTSFALCEANNRNIVRMENIKFVAQLFVKRVKLFIVSYLSDANLIVSSTNFSPTYQLQNRRFRRGYETSREIMNNENNKIIYIYIYIYIYISFYIIIHAKYCNKY